MMGFNSSPWGQVQNVKTYADGIDFISTAGHGGFKLSPARQREIKALFEFDTFAGGAWYEEDCDAALVVIAFPEFFKPDQVSQAASMVAGNARYYKAASVWAREKFGIEVEVSV